MTSNQYCRYCNQVVKSVYNILQPHTKEGKEYLPSDFVLHVPLCSGKRSLAFYWEDSIPTKRGY